MILRWLAGLNPNFNTHKSVSYAVSYADDYN
jgi:hypothetical protein